MLEEIKNLQPSEIVVLIAFVVMAFQILSVSPRNIRPWIIRFAHVFLMLGCVLAISLTYLNFSIFPKTTYQLAAIWLGYTVSVVIIAQSIQWLRVKKNEQSHG